MKSSLSLYTGILCLVIFLAGHSPARCQTLNNSVAGVYAEASYNGLTDNAFMKNWWVAGPVRISRDANVPDDKAQRAFFDKDELFSFILIYLV